MRQRIDMFLSMALLYLPPPPTPNSQHPRLSPPTAGNAPMARQWKAAHICRYWETMNWELYAIVDRQIVLYNIVCCFNPLRLPLLSPPLCYASSPQHPFHPFNPFSQKSWRQNLLFAHFYLFVCLYQLTCAHLRNTEKKKERERQRRREEEWYPSSKCDFYWLSLIKNMVGFIGSGRLTEF